MTHSIIFEIKSKDWEKIQQIKETVETSEEFIGLYQLRKTQYCYDQKNGSQPFIYFPHKDDKEEGYYSIFIETGSHVAPEDELYALHWYFFTIAFRRYFKDEIKGLAMGYRLDGENELHDDEWIKKEIGVKF